VPEKKKGVSFMDEAVTIIGAKPIRRHGAGRPGPAGGRPGPGARVERR
jgi:hypothetical protein